MQKQEQALFGFKGWLEIRDNKTKELILKTPNIIVDGGLAIAAKLLGDATAAALTKAWVGSGNTAVEVDDDAMETPLGAAVVPTVSSVTTLVTNDTMQAVSVHTAGVGGWAVKEYGLFSSADVMFNHVVFSVINLAEANELEFTYKVQVQRVI
jgi:uncharacterized MnhB-related membrane protein